MKLIKKIIASVALLTAVCNLQAYDLRTGILSYYPFNTSTTTDAVYTNNFTAVGAPVLSTTNPAPRDSFLQLN